MAQTIPVLPEAFESLVVDAEEPVVSALVKTAVQLPVLLYKVWRWAFTVDGEATPEFRAWICEGCEAISSDTTSTAE